MDVHVIADTYGPHKHPKVWQWLANHPLLHHALHAYIFFHGSTKSSDGLGQIPEKSNPPWLFSEHEGTQEQDFVANYNEYARPFMWTATADSILKKVEKRCKLINGTPY